MSSSVTKILLVEDNPGDARLIRETLAEAEGNGFQIDWVPKLSAALEKLNRGEIDLVLLDLGLPDSRGLDTFVQAYAQAPQIPFVVLSGLNDETVALTAVREGAQDYLVKGQTDGAMLLRAIRYATERKRIEEELRLANEELRREIEERRAAELAVEAERQRLYALMDGLPAFVSLIGPDFSFLFANKVFEKTFGDWHGKHCYELMFGKKAVCECCPALDVLDRRALNIKEMTVPGNGRVYNIYKYPFTERDGTTLVLSLGIDITERKRAEEALEAERQRLFSLLDGLPGLVYLKAPDYSLRFANRQFRELCGDWQGRKCFETIFHREQPCDNCTQFSVLKTGEPTVKEATYDGGNRTYEVYSYPFADVDGSSLVLTLSIDITQRKEAERSLKESEEKFRSIVETAQEGVWWIGADAKTVYVNERMAEMVGCSPEEMLGRHAKDFIPVEEHHDLEIRVAERRQGIKSTFERRLQKPDGSVVRTYVSGSPFIDESGQYLGALGMFTDITEHKQTEEEIKASEIRFRELFDNMSNGVAVYEAVNDGEDFIFKDFNRAAEWLDQVDRDEIVSHSIQDLFPNVREFGLFNVLKRVWQTGKAEYFPASFYKDERISGWRENYVYKLPSGDLVAIFTDITERMQAEEALRQSEARLAKAQQLAHLGHWEWDLQSKEVNWSEEVYRIFGLNPENFIPTPEEILNYVHPEDRERVNQGLKDAMAGVKPYNLVNRLVQPDGSIRYVHSQAEAVFDERGGAKRMLGTAQDITERRVAEIRLRESEARFRAIFDSAAMAIGLTDMEGQLLTTNKTFQQMYEYGEEELRHKTLTELTHPEDIGKSHELFEALKVGRVANYQIEKRYRRKNGQYFWGRATVSIIKDLEGRPRYTIGMVQDITQEREAEEKLHESEQRLRILASQLMTAQEDERKRISRELHDELGQALLVLKLQTRAVKDNLKTNQAELQKECQEMLGNLDQVVDKVRRLSRDLSPTILEDLGLTVALHHLIGEFGKHYQIKYRAPEAKIDDLFPLASQTAIYRIVQESLTNIGKHSQADQLQIVIEKSQRGVSFLIQDDGKGFNPAEQWRQNPGMGLASMEERARMIGGSLSVWSREGVGTKIFLEIPCSASSE